MHRQRNNKIQSSHWWNLSIRKTEKKPTQNLKAFFFSVRMCFFSSYTNSFHGVYLCVNTIAVYIYTIDVGIYVVYILRPYTYRYWKNKNKTTTTVVRSYTNLLIRMLSSFRAFFYCQLTEITFNFGWDCGVCVCLLYLCYCTFIL